ncbi:MAG: hypothetical protein N4A35_04470 [Flavobacteriales bacterium]|nr:hypothetical protein [Flavobacteriales bacterium]
MGLKVVIVSTVTLVLLELCYRYQVIDFYKTEWKYLNQNIAQNKTGKKVLVLGDSFSSTKNNWVDQLRKLDTNNVYYNASFPGVGTETYRLIAPKRMEEVNPDKVIVQLYVGNDLLDIAKPINWSKLSFSRNLFWSLSNNLRFLNYLNYRMGQVSQDVVKTSNPKEVDEFSIEHYSARTQLYIQAMPNYPQNVVTLADDDTFKALVKHLNEIKRLVKKEAFYVLIIPHCVEVNQRYIENYKLLGTQLTTENLMEDLWASELEKAGFEVINPGSSFRKIEENGTSIYYQNDPHLNKFGQEVLANKMALYFQNR